MLVRVSVVGGPSERKLPPRALQEVGYALAFHPNLVQFVFGKSSQLRSLLPSQFFNMQDICVLFTVCRILKCGRYLLKCSSLKRYHHYRRTPLVKCPFFICHNVWGRQTLRHLTAGGLFVQCSELDICTLITFNHVVCLCFRLN